MDVRHCPDCGQLYRSAGARLCALCLARDEEQFNKVRQFLRQNPGATLTATEDATGVKAGRILKWLKAGMLEVMHGRMPGLQCERCGDSITSGKYCAGCRASLERVLQGSTSVGSSPSAGSSPAAGSRPAASSRPAAGSSPAGRSQSSGNAEGRSHDWARRRGRT